jgi:hypothetical protein
MHKPAHGHGHCHAHRNPDFFFATEVTPGPFLRVWYTHIKHTPNSRCAICSGFEDTTKMRANGRGTCLADLAADQATYDFKPFNYEARAIIMQENFPSVSDQQLFLHRLAATIPFDFDGLPHKHTNQKRLILKYMAHNETSSFKLKDMFKCQ